MQAQFSPVYNRVSYSCCDFESILISIMARHDANDDCIVISYYIKHWKTLIPKLNMRRRISIKYVIFFGCKWPPIASMPQLQICTHEIVLMFVAHTLHTNMDSVWTLSNYFRNWVDACSTFNGLCFNFNIECDTERIAYEILVLVFRR